MAMGARSGEQRRQARRVARLLAPAAARIDGFASAEARVQTRPGLVLRPDVCVARGEPPYDGVLARAPLLVVVLGPPAEAAAWVTLGAGAVWSLAARGACLHLPGGRVAVLPPGGRLTVPGAPGIELAVSDFRSPGVAPRAAAAPPPAPERPSLRPA